MNPTCRTEKMVEKKSTVLLRGKKYLRTTTIETTTELVVSDTEQGPETRVVETVKRVSVAAHR